MTDDPTVSATAHRGATSPAADQGSRPRTHDPSIPGTAHPGVTSPAAQPGAER